MSRLILSGLLGACWSSALLAQWPGNPPPPVAVPPLRSVAPTPEAFLPVGWKIEAMERGPVDGDARTDAVIVIKDTQPINLVEIEGSDGRYDSNPRMLVVLLGTPDGYRLGEQNATLIPRLANMNQDDLFDRLTLTDGTIGVAMHEHFEAGGWKLGTTRYKLRWNGRRLVAIGFDFDGMTRDGQTRKTSANFRTGKVVQTLGSTDGETPATTRTIRIPRQHPSLAAIGDGLTFDPLQR